MIKKTLISIGTSLLIILLGLIIFIGTPFGLDSAVALTEKFSNNRIQITNAQGSLMSKLSIGEIRYITKHQRLIVKAIKINWRPIYLFIWRLHIKKLSVNSIDFVSLKTLPKKHPSKKTSSLSMPQLDIENIRINQTHYYNTQTRQNYQLGQTRLLAKFNTQQLTIQGKSSLKEPYAITLSINVSGKPNNYQLKTNIVTPIISTAITGQGNRNNLALKVNETSSLGGQLRGDIQLQWQPQFSLKTELTAQRLQLGDHWISGPININYKGFNQFHIDTQLATSLGQIDIKGDHQKRWQLQWNINLTHLERLSPLLLGSIQGRGAITGNSSTPDATGELNFKQLTFEQYKLEQLNTKWALHIGQNKTSTLRINLKQLQSGDLAIEQAELNAKGTQENHHIQLNARTALGTLHMQAQAGYRPKHARWHATINQLKLTSTELSNWYLLKPLTINWGKTEQRIKPFCWKSTRGGQLCGQFSRDKQWQAQLNATLDLSALPGLHADNLGFRGTLATAAHVAGDNSGITDANISLNGRHMQALLDTGSLKKTITLKKIQLQLQLADKKLTLQQQLLTSQGDYCQIQLNASPIHHLNSDINPRLDGQIKLKLGQLQDLKYSLPATIDPKGSLKANVKIGGRLMNPDIKAAINAQKTSVALPDLGITLTNATLSANTSKHTLITNAKLYSNKQAIRIHSSANLKHYSFDGKTTLQGNNIPVINTLDYRINVSPKINLTIKNKVVTINGDINVPSGTISPKNFNSTVTLPHSDIVYVNQAPSIPNAWRSQLALNVKLGKDVKVNTYGVTGRLAGDLKISQQADQALQGNGKVTLEDGLFKSHGHKLKISNAAIIFRNSVLENPELDITASRTLNTYSSAGILMLGVDNLTVGMHITGHAKEPKINLFSAPVSLNDTDILSYMLLGHSASGSSAADLTLVLNAFNGGGSGGVGGLVGNLEQGLGLTEFGIQSETALDISGNPIDSQNSFVVGKYVTPKIYLRYSRGLVDENNTILLRYMITPKWAVQTSQSNLGTGGDIIYTFYRH